MRPPFEISNKMLNLIVEITQKVTRLELEQERNLRLRKENRVRSIQSSLAIEDNSLNLEQVTDIIEGKRVLGKPKEIREVQNAYEAYELVFRMNPYSIEDILQAHALMTRDLIKDSGRFRKQDVGVYDAAGNVIHIGTRPQFITSAMTELFNWAAQDETPDLIKSCVLHFEIEMIHPFSDGNGRMGRLWQNLILSKWNKIFQWIPIDTIVYQNQSQYYDMLAIGGKENDSSKFIEFMLEVILQTVSDIYVSREEYSEPIILSDKTRDKVSDKMNDNEKLFFKKIYPYLKVHGEIGNAKATQLSQKSSGTARRYLVRLVELGFLATKGENRNRKYILLDTV